MTRKLVSVPAVIYMDFEIEMPAGSSDRDAIRAVVEDDGVGVFMGMSDVPLLASSVQLRQGMGRISIRATVVDAVVIEGSALDRRER